MNYLTTSRINDMNRLLNQFHSSSRPTVVQRGFKVDIAESPEGYQIYADLPGFEAENVDVRVEEKLLIIEAKRSEQNEVKQEVEDKRSWHVRERREENLKRSFLLPEDVNKEDVEAELKNGVLTVNLKKKPEAKPFTVKIKGK